MAQNQGKKFEKQFEKDWKDSFLQPFLLRLKDNTSGYFGSSRNPSDFIAYQDGLLFLLECKSHDGNTFPFSKLTQYDDLASYEGIPGVEPGLILWMKEHDRVMFFPISTISAMMSNGDKSINVRKLDGVDYLELPSTKKRVFMKTRYDDIIDYVRKRRQ